MSVLKSFIAGEWVGEQQAKALPSAINGEIVAHTHADTLDFKKPWNTAEKPVGKPCWPWIFRNAPWLLKLWQRTCRSIKRALCPLDAHRLEQIG